MKALLLFLVLFPLGAQGALQGLERIDSLVRELPRYKEDTNKVLLLNTIAGVYKTHDPGKGVEYGGQGLSLARQLKWTRGEAMAHVSCGNNHLYLGNSDKALAHYTAAQQLYEQLGDKKGTAQAMGNRAALYYAGSNYAKALEYWIDALRIFEELKDKEGIAKQTGNIGTVYCDQGNLPQAMKYCVAARQLFADLGQNESVALMEGNIGNIYARLDSPAEALTHDLKAIAIYEQTGNDYGIARNYINMSNIYSARKDYEQALDYQSKALKIYERINYKEGLGKSYINMGEYYLRMVNDTVGGRPRLTPAVRRQYLGDIMGYAGKAIKIHEEASNLYALAYAWGLLAEAQIALGMYKDAVHSQAQHARYQDSVFSIDNNKKIADLTLNRELEIRDKKIEIDRLTIAKKRNESIFYISAIVLLLGSAIVFTRNVKLASAKKVSEEKLNVFQARMNPHFIFNSLSSIQSLVLNNETISCVKYLSEFSKLMRQVLDSSGKNKTLLQTEVEMLQSYIKLEQLRFDSFSWSMTLAEDIDAASVYIPAMIIQPFVENAIIHGIVPLKGSGLLTISMERKGAQIVCTVDDNGIGRKRAQELKQSNDKDRQSHGIDITVRRLALLNDRKRGVTNSVTYIDKEENGLPAGTRVIIQIPVL